MPKAFLQRSEKKIDVIYSILVSVKGLKGTATRKIWGHEEILSTIPLSIVFYLQDTLVYQT